jgi:hypothetical protein
MSDEYDISVGVSLLSDGDDMIVNEQEFLIFRDDFETICEARSWMKAGTEPFVELLENKFIDGFVINFNVVRKDAKAVDE